VQRAQSRYFSNTPRIFPCAGHIFTFSQCYKDSKKSQGIGVLINFHSSIKSTKY